ncbi:hypothetical protein [Bacillus mycoides]|uniref:hypothetical protein n=1 Tax=Bacillus mycoides TaxID=1405 RepID=UPI0011A490FB|nr:hypothetical protein [Bacillus mycoides]
MEKQHIEFLLENEEHLKQLERLSKLWNEYIDGAFNGIANSKEHDKDKIQADFNKLIEENYLIDSDCDPYGVIEEGLLSAVVTGHPHILLSAIKQERERRHTRKRHPKKSWERLKELGLE